MYFSNCVLRFFCPLYCSTRYKVVLGAHSLSQPEDTKQTFDMDLPYKHPNFNIQNYDNDIALVKVKHIKSCNRNWEVEGQEGRVFLTVSKTLCWVPLAYHFLCNLQLSQPVTETDAVKPLKFQRAGGSDPDKDSAVETAGWGSLDNLGNRPDKLHEVTVAVLKRSYCGSSRSYADSFTSNMLCAAKTRMDTCDVSFHLRLTTVSL